MKQKLFISYSHKDIDKVELVIAELKNHPTLEAIVIANDREAGKLLAEKVRSGIEHSKIIIPIISANSISEQWINQEIGYATAHNKIIMPIIENGLIDALKGFIHKQIDLPYSYNRKPTNSAENRSFIEHFRQLIADIENNLDAIINRGNEIKPPDPDKELLELTVKDLKNKNAPRIIFTSIMGSKKIGLRNEGKRAKIAEIKLLNDNWFLSSPPSIPFYLNSNMDWFLHLEPKNSEIRNVVGKPTVYSSITNSLLAEINIEIKYEDDLGTKYQVYFQRQGSFPKLTEPIEIK
jgi:TIR domain